MKCEDSTEFFDMNLDLLLLEDTKATGTTGSLAPLDLGTLVQEQGDLGDLSHKVDFGLLASEISGMTQISDY